MNQPTENPDLLERLETESNYGSEFGTDDEATLSHLLAGAEYQSTSQDPIHESVGKDTGIQIGYEQDTVSVLVTPRTREFIDEHGVPFQTLVFDGPIRGASGEVEYNARNRIAFSCK